MFKSIRARLIASYVFLTFFTVVMIGVLGVGLVQGYARQQEREFLFTNAQAIAHQAAPFLGLAAGGELGLSRLTQSAAFLGDIEVQIFDADDRLLSASVGALDSAELAWLPLVGPAADDPDMRPVFIFTVDPEQLPEERAALLTALREGERRRMSRADEAETDAAAQATAGEIITIRRAPSFWGNRLSFETTPHAMMEHHAHMGSPAFVFSRQRQITSTHAMHMDGSAMPGPTAGGPLSGLWGQLARVLEPPATRLLQTPGAGEQIAVAVMGDGNAHLGTVTVSRAGSLQGQPFAALGGLFLIAAAGAVVLASLVGLGVSRSLTAPIQSLGQVAARMAGGELGARAPIHSEDELGRLARQFNRMAQQLEQSFTAIQQERDTLRRFVADASHELRTPMTALRTFTELLQGDAGQDPDRRAEFLGESEAQLVRLEWITRNLLDLSRLDAGIAVLELTRQDVGSLAQAALAPFRNQAQAGQVKLVLNPSLVPVEWVCDGARIEIALRNLIDNALKFTPPGGRIEVGFRAMQTNSVNADDVDDPDDPDDVDDVEGVDDSAQRRAGVRMWVQDTGPGIAPADRARIFNRFERGSYAPREGSGLGLAIVQSIVQAHGGRVTVRDAGDGPATGSRFEITLPSPPPAPDVQSV